MDTAWPSHWFSSSTSTKRFRRIRSYPLIRSYGGDVDLRSISSIVPFVPPFTSICRSKIKANGTHWKVNWFNTCLHSESNCWRMMKNTLHKREVIISEAISPWLTLPWFRGFLSSIQIVWCEGWFEYPSSSKSIKGLHYLQALTRRQEKYGSEFTNGSMPRFLDPVSLRRQAMSTSISKSTRDTRGTPPTAQSQEQHGPVKAFHKSQDIQNNFWFSFCLCLNAHECLRSCPVAV